MRASEIPGFNGHLYIFYANDQLPFYAVLSYDKEPINVCGPFGVSRFISEIEEYRERNMIQEFGEDNMIFEYKGRKGFAGSLAKYESELGGSRKGGTKAHNDAKIRILLAIHRYSDDMINDIVVGQPIGLHNE